MKTQGVLLSVLSNSMDSSPLLINVRFCRTWLPVCSYIFLVIISIGYGQDYDLAPTIPATKIIPHEIPKVLPTKNPASRYKIEVINVASGGPSSTTTFASSGYSSSQTEKSSSQTYKVEVSYIGEVAYAPRETMVEWFAYKKQLSTKSHNSNEPAVHDFARKKQLSTKSDNSNELAVHDNGSLPIDLVDKRKAVCSFKTKPLKRLDFSTASNRSTTGNLTIITPDRYDQSSGVRGDKIMGWFVRLKVGDEIVAVKGSTSSFEKLGWDMNIQRKK